MLVDTILPSNISHQLLNSYEGLDPLESYIDDLLSTNEKQVVSNWQDNQTILNSQQIDNINSDLSLTNTLQILRLTQTLEKKSVLYESLMQRIEMYFEVSESNYDKYSQ